MPSSALQNPKQQNIGDDVGVFFKWRTDHFIHHTQHPNQFIRKAHKSVFMAMAW